MLMKRILYTFLVPLCIAAMEQPGSSKVQEQAIKRIAEKILQGEQSITTVRQKVEPAVYEKVVKEVKKISPIYRLSFSNPLRSEETLSHFEINEPINEQFDEKPSSIWRARVLESTKNGGPWYFDTKKRAEDFIQNKAAKGEHYSIRSFGLSKGGIYTEIPK